MKQKNICDELLYSNDDILGIIYHQRRPTVKGGKSINKYNRDIHNEASLLINDIEIKDLIYLEYNFNIEPINIPRFSKTASIKITPPSIGLIYTSIRQGKFEIQCDNVHYEKDRDGNYYKLNFTSSQFNDIYTIVFYDEN